MCDTVLLSFVSPIVICCFVYNPSNSGIGSINFSFVSHEYICSDFGSTFVKFSEFCCIIRSDTKSVDVLVVDSNEFLVLRLKSVGVITELVATGAELVFS